jgi:hypothetical protein
MLVGVSGGARLGDVVRRRVSAARGVAMRTFTVVALFVAVIIAIELAAMLAWSACHV